MKTTINTATQEVEQSTKYIVSDNTAMFIDLLKKESQLQYEIAKAVLSQLVRFFVFSSFYIWISAHNLSEIIGEITLNINQPLNTKKLAIFVMDKEPLNCSFYTFWY